MENNSIKQLNEKFTALMAKAKTCQELGVIENYNCAARIFNTESYNFSLEVNSWGINHISWEASKCYEKDVQVNEENYNRLDEYLTKQMADCLDDIKVKQAIMNEYYGN